MRIGTRLISWIGERRENEKWQLIGFSLGWMPPCPRGSRSLHRTFNNSRSGKVFLVKIRQRRRFLKGRKVQRNSKNKKLNFSKVPVHSRSDSIFAWTESEQDFAKNSEWGRQFSKISIQWSRMNHSKSRTGNECKPASQVKDFRNWAIRLIKIQIQKTSKVSFIR
jgi:hypothetical protein